MKHFFLSLLIVLALHMAPATAEETPAQLAVKARASVLACTLEILSMEDAAKYPDVLAKGITLQAKQLSQVENIIDELDEDEVLAAENHLPASANFVGLVAEYRRVMGTLAAQLYYGCEALEDAMEDLEDAIQDME